MSRIVLPLSDDERVEDLRALSKMAAHMETLLDDIGITDSAPRFCLETFRALIAKELQQSGALPGSLSALSASADRSKIN